MVPGKQVAAWWKGADTRRGPRKGRHLWFTESENNRTGGMHGLVVWKGGGRYGGGLKSWHLTSQLTHLHLHSFWSKLNLVKLRKNFEKIILFLRRAPWDDDYDNNYKLREKSTSVRLRSTILGNNRFSTARWHGSNSIDFYTTPPPPFSTLFAPTRPPFLMSITS